MAFEIGNEAEGLLLLVVVALGAINPALASRS